MEKNSKRLEPFAMFENDVYSHLPGVISETTIQQQANMNISFVAPINYCKEMYYVTN